MQSQSHFFGMLSVPYTLPCPGQTNNCCCGWAAVCVQTMSNTISEPLTEDISDTKWLLRAKVSRNKKPVWCMKDIKLFLLFKYLPWSWVCCSFESLDLLPSFLTVSSSPTLVCVNLHSAQVDGGCWLRAQTGKAGGLTSPCPQLIVVGAVQQVVLQAMWMAMSLCMLWVT